MTMLNRSLMLKFLVILTAALLTVALLLDRSWAWGLVPTFGSLASLAITQKSATSDGSWSVAIDQMAFNRGVQASRMSLLLQFRRVDGWPGPLGWGRDDSSASGLDLQNPLVRLQHRHP